MHPSDVSQPYTPQQLDAFITQLEHLLQRLKEAKACAASARDLVISLLQSISQQTQRLIEERQANLSPPLPTLTTAADPATASPGSDPREAPELRATASTGPLLRDCRYSDLNPLNEELLERLYRKAGGQGYLHFSVVDLEPLSVSGVKVKQPDIRHVKSFTYEVDGSFTRVRQAGHKRPIAFPDFPLASSRRRRRLSPDALKETWLEAVKSHQSKSIYIVGPPLFDDIQLSPGEKLLQRGSAPDSLPGIQTSYGYYSLSHGAHLTAMHREDINLLSVNVLRSGEAKLWLIINPEHTNRFEDCVRQEFQQTSNCTQFVRHLGISICPTKLDSWGIRYSIVCCEAGQAIITGTGVYHQILNLGTNYARAINIEFTSSPDVPQDYKFCTKACDRHVVNESHIQLRGIPKQAKASLQLSASDLSPSTMTGMKREASESGKPLPKKARKTTEYRPNRSALLIAQELNNLRADMELRDKLWRFPQLTMNPSINCAMARRVCAVQGGPAVRQFCSLIVYRRECKLEAGALPLTASVVQRTAHLLRRVDQLCHGANHDQVVIRLLQFYIAQQVDRSEAGTRTRADPQLINNIMQEVGWRREERQRFHGYLKRGRKWRRVCGRYPGILCFIPVQKQEPYSVAAENYLEMADDEIESFQTSLDTPFIRHISRSAEFFQESVLGTKHDTEFTWEMMYPDLSNCKEAKSEDELKMLLQPLWTHEHNVYDVEQYPKWPRPPSWPEEFSWPVDPTLMQNGEQHCELCVQTFCDCIQERFSVGKLCIRRDTKRKLGLQAVAVREGDVAYSPNEFIGRISGMVVPAGTFDDEWAHNLTQTASLDGSVICQIYVKERGNCFRHLQSSDQPNVRIRQMAISGRRTKVVMANQTIYHGQWITAGN